MLNGVTGQILAVRTGRIRRTQIGSSGYPQLNVVDDEGQVQTRTEHSLVLLAWAGPCPPGKEARHLDDNPLNNRWEPGNEEETRAAGGNLVWGTRSENELDKAFNNPRPKRPVPPPKVCVLCKAEFTGHGRRCHPCVVDIGERGAKLLRSGMKLEAAAAEIGYPSESGLYNLAVKYGGLGQPRSHRAMVTLRDKLRRVTRRDRSRAGDRL
jgi:hypothetical protein